MGEDQTLIIHAEGSDSTKTAACRKVAVEAMSAMSDVASEQIRADIDAKKAEVEQLQADVKAKQEEIRQAITEKRAQAEHSALDFDMELEMPAVDLDLDFDFDMNSYLPVQNVKVTYLHGNEQWKMFDFYGPVFIGIFLFVFVFITSGMSLVNERSAGTMERFLATPVRPTQILGGYVLGFGAFAAVQAAVVLWFCLCCMHFPNEGSIALVILVAVLLALVSVTMGLLVSGLARNAFQVIQLMLVFVVPQILLSGLFDLSVAPAWMQMLSMCLPAQYGVDALRAIMLRGADLHAIGFDLAVLAGFVLVFFALAALRFKKKQARQRSKRCPQGQERGTGN